LEKMREENTRVCNSPLGSVSNLDAAFILVLISISFSISLTPPLKRKILLKELRHVFLILKS